MQGCVPAKIVDVPAISGSVRSASTNLPLAGAIITIDGVPGTRALTDERGTFQLVEKSHTRWERIGGDLNGGRLLRVSLPGFVPTSVVIYVAGSENVVIQLKPRDGA